MSQSRSRLEQVKHHLKTSRSEILNVSSKNESSTSGPPPSSTSSNEPPRPSKLTAQAKASFYKYWLPFQTKWHENDMYDHLNNAVYVTYFDAIINEYLITRCKMRPSSTDAPIGLVVSSSFSYNAALEFPAPLLAGLAVTKLGKSSVTYGVALFASAKKLQTADISRNTFKTELELTTDAAAAYGEMTHVFVDPHTRRPVPIPEAMRAELSKLQQ